MCGNASYCAKIIVPILSQHQPITSPLPSSSALAAAVIKLSCHFSSWQSPPALPYRCVPAIPRHLTSPRPPAHLLPLPNWPRSATTCPFPSRLCQIVYSPSAFVVEPFCLNLFDPSANLFANSFPHFDFCLLNYRMWQIHLCEIFS